MDDPQIFQTTIWGPDVVLQTLVTARQKLCVRLKHRPAPLFEDASNSRQLVGVPPRLRKAFYDAAKRHSEEHPTAKPMTYAAFLRKQGAQRSAGRPSRRPDHVTDKALWSAYLRAVARIVKDNTTAKTPSFDEWIVSSEKWRKCGQRGGIAAKNSLRQTVQWVVVVPRRELTKDPSIERDWSKRLFNDEALAKTHRIALRGVLRKVS